MTDTPIIFDCQVADSWRHKFDLWRHRGDTVSFMRTIHPKYSTEMHQNTTFYAELNGEHAGEGFMPLRSILVEIWTREYKKSRNFRKFDLWPAITGSNIDLGHNNTTNREYSASAICWSFPRSSTTLRLESPGGSHPPPPTPAKVAKHRLRARVKGRVPPSWHNGFRVLYSSNHITMFPGLHFPIFRPWNTNSQICTYLPS